MLFNFDILTGSGLKRDLLHCEGTRLILSLLELVEELSLVALSLVEDVRLRFEARFDVLKTAFGLHEYNLGVASLTIEFIHVESAGGHAFCTFNISDERKHPILAAI